MKKLYLIVTLLLFAIGNVMGQNPNNHWQLGNTDIDFSSNLPTASIAGVSSQYGNASISDDNGNLLFYTNGMTVWNKNHQIMTNGGNIGNTGVMNTIIVPNIGNSNQFYIFRSEEYLCLCSVRKPIYYLFSIVEFNNTNPLGILLQNNNNPLFDTPENQYSKALFDSSGIVANNFNFGALTSTKNSQSVTLTSTIFSPNDSFWVIAQSKNKLLSYKIDTSGLNLTPIESNFTDQQIYAYGNYNSSSGRVDGIEGANFKLSPDNNTLVGLQFSKVTLNSNDPDSNFLNFKNFFYKTNFDLATGLFSTYQLLNGTGLMVYEFEISSQSNNLYFIRMKYPFPNPSYPNILDGEIVVKDLANDALPTRTLSLFGTTTPSSLFNFIQRDKNGKILISSTSSTDNKNKYIHVIDNQDNFNSSSVLTNYLFLNNNIINKFPQLIPLISSSCPSTLAISNTITSSIDKKQAANTITASNIINSGAGAIYHAGTSVTFTVPFNAKSGSTLHTYVAGCTGTYVARQSQTNTSATINDVENSLNKDEIIKVFPNPNNGIFKIALNEVKEGSVQITDLYGFTIYKTNFKNENEFDINMQEKPKGIYIVKVISENFTYSSKIIKN